MRISWFGLLAALILPGAPAQAAAAEKAGEGLYQSFHDSAAAAASWLKQLDSGQYDEAWKQASARLTQAAPKDDWVTQTAAERELVGPALKRTQILQQARRTSDLAKTMYYVFIFETTFQKQGKMFETLTIVQERDQQWRVAAYLLR